MPHLRPFQIALFFYALHHLWRQAGGDGGFLWIHWDPWEGTPTEARIRERIQQVFTYFSTNRDEVIVSAYPGYNDVYAQHQPLLDYHDGKTLQETLDVGMEGPWPLIQLATWNDYGEGTMIEPTHEFGYTFLEIMQQARRKELGPGFYFHRRGSAAAVSPLRAPQERKRPCRGAGSHLSTTKHGSLFGSSQTARRPRKNLAPIPAGIPCYVPFDVSA